jgi:hypothetical protein
MFVKHVLDTRNKHVLLFCRIKHKYRSINYSHSVRDLNLFIDYNVTCGF